MDIVKEATTWQIDAKKVIIVHPLVRVGFHIIVSGFVI